MARWIAAAVVALILLVTAGPVQADPAVAPPPQPIVPQLTSPPETPVVTVASDPQETSLAAWLSDCVTAAEEASQPATAAPLPDWWHTAKTFLGLK